MFEPNFVVHTGLRKQEKKINLLLARYSTELRKRCKQDASDSETLSKKKELIPEETFENWIQEDNINKNVASHLETINAIKKSRPYEEDENEIEEEDDEEEEEEEEEDHDRESDQDNEVPNTPDKEIRRGHQYSKLIEAHFQARVKGLEILPYVRTIDDQSTFDNPSTRYFTRAMSYTRRHIRTLTTLLHINVYRENWETAYRCFCLLIRSQDVDLRALWPIGLEILTRRSEFDFEKLDDSQDDSFDYSTKVLKDEQFLNWIQNYYIISRQNNATVHRRLPLAYRTGTITAAPLYVLTLVWLYLIRGKFKIVNEKLAELLLLRPYLNEGIFHFLQGLSCMIESSKLSKEESMDKQQIEQLLTKAEKCFQEAKDLEADFPEDLMSNELKLIKIKITENLDVQREDLEKAFLGQSDLDMVDADQLPSDEISSDISSNFDGHSDGLKRQRNLDSEDDYDFNADVSNSAYNIYSSDDE